MPGLSCLEVVRTPPKKYPAPLSSFPVVHRLCLGPGPAAREVRPGASEGGSMKLKVGPRTSPTPNERCKALSNDKAE
ncbi:unnamed protein product [Arctogadus glacialis]